MAITTTPLLLILLLATITTASTSSDHYLLSCGASSTVSNTLSTYDNQIWNSDNNSTFSNNFSSTIAATSTTLSTVPQIPFSTARIFTANFTYSFPVSPGPKFIRLFFYPSTYSSFSSSDSYLTLQTNTGNLLLHNFSAYLSTTSSMLKEFYVHLNTSLLQLTLSPTPPSTHAFINGIEIVSVPDTLYVGPTAPHNVAQPGVPFELNNFTALEMAYRLNVGGKELSPTDDAGSMRRQWEIDENYLMGNFDGSTGYASGYSTVNYTAATPSYTAPDLVYLTFRWMGKVSDEEKRGVNVTWGFEVDSGFNYLVRLHWCEVTVDINASNYRVFDVYMDGVTVETGADVFQWVGADTPVYRDYVVYVGGGDGSGSKGVLQLAMHPNTHTQSRYLDILLNGLEIFKLSRANGSLDAPNPFRTPTPSPNQLPPPTKSNSSSSHIVPAIVGAIAGAVVIALILFLIHRRNRSKQSSTGPWSSTTGKSQNLFTPSYLSGSATSTATGRSTLPSDLCRRFSLSEIRRATSDFSDALIIGRGGFGNVYKGTVDGCVEVAVKRLNSQSKQGAREFTTEIDLLSKLRHVNLVSLIGFCDEAGEMVLVYEYMTRGTLRDHIFLSSIDPGSPERLSWLKRLEICVGAARGLHYLHAGAGHMIIHRDVKSTNILVDEKWVAKMSDFGLSKLGPTGGDLSHISTAVKGSFGYVDPEYYKRQQLTEKSDVYSFGVVLFEVLCGRAAVGLGLPKEQVNLALWGRRNQLSGTLGDIVDPSLKGEIAPECLRKFGEVAESCVRDVGAERPSMSDVVWGLEFALQLQSEATKNSDGGWSTTVTYKSSDSLAVEFGTLGDSTGVGITSTTTTSESGDHKNMMTSRSSELFSGSSDQSHNGSTKVFSQIYKPQGR